MQRYGELMREIAEREIDGWPVGQPFALRPRTQAITLEIIMRTVFGIDDAERLARLRERLGRDARHRHAEPCARGDRDPAGAHARSAARIWKRFLRLRADGGRRVIYDEIARRRRPRDVAERDDVLSILLQARDEDGAPDDRRRSCATS